MKNFDKYKTLFKWIYELSEKDQDWALQYLSGKGIKFEAGSQQMLGAVPNTAENRELNIKLKNAFRQRKIRERRIGTKTHSIALSKTATKTLDKISAEMATSKTYVIELLLSEEKELRSKKNQIKKQEKIRGDLNAMTQINNILEKELSFALTRLAAYQLHEQNPATQDTPLAIKKSSIEAIFKELWQNSKNNMKIFGLKMSPYQFQFEPAWNRLTNRQSQSNPTNNTDSDSATRSRAEYAVDFNLDAEP